LADQQQTLNHIPFRESGAAKSAWKTFIGLFIPLVVGILLFIFFIFLSWLKLASKNILGGYQIQFETPLFPGILLLEMFAIFLAGYFAGLIPNNFLPGISAQGRLLLGGILMVGLSGLALSWPLLLRIRFTDICKTLGLILPENTSWGREVFIGFLVFFASWPLILLTAWLSEKLMSSLGINTLNAMHPLVPALMKSLEAHLLWIVFSLVAIAVFVAAIFEEIIFRGIFYSGLRWLAPSWIAVIFSAMLFALLHPQGIVGLLPIFLIGCILAWLREWRHSLIAPMVMHGSINLTTVLVILLLFSSQ
jgi:membrane protease YdiL (CAAX protease family)